jgi:hypothetical protein
VSDEPDKALIPLEERAVDFYQDEIVAVLVDVEGQSLPQVYVPIRPICDFLGVSFAGQRERINRDPVLEESMRIVRVTRTNQGGNPNVLCLPLEYLPGWLFGLNVNRVRQELREKIIRYQKECYRVLWQAFHDDSLSEPVRGRGLSPSANEVALTQIREMGLAIVQMAEQQLALERRMATSESRLDRAAAVVGQIQQRLAAVEYRLAPGQPVTDEQATEISATVKALAEFLAGQDKSKNHYQGIFAELYRRFGVSSYKLIPATKFDPVMAFLDDWRRAAGGE